MGWIVVWSYCDRTNPGRWVNKLVGGIELYHFTVG